MKQKFMKHIAAPLFRTWVRLKYKVRMWWGIMVGSHLFALKMRLAMKWIQQEGLSVCKITTVGNATYIEDATGTRYKVGRKG